jgi:hypothetical protein
MGIPGDHLELSLVVVGERAHGALLGVLTERGKPRKGVDRTTAHRDHIHFRLSWAGRGSGPRFWRGASDGY